MNEYLNLRNGSTFWARDLLILLLDETHQKSGLLMTPDHTEWYTREEA